MILDPRATPLRDGVAGQALEGLVPAEVYLEPRVMACALPVAGIHRTPDPASEMLDQLVFGELFEVLEDEAAGFVWGQARRDGYVGFVAAERLAARLHALLRRAAGQAKSLLDAKLPMGHVAVNLSARQFRDRRLVARIGEILDNTGLEPTRLELEITESLVMHDVESVIGKLKELKALGILLSIDDFGTGYSSLSYLRRFPIDRIKIDQSFTREVDSSPDAAAIARAVIQLGHALGLLVIAEGVESEGQLRFLRENGCDEIQGYIYARPLDPEALRTLLASSPKLPG